jgi:hypothetical protein
MGTLLTIKLKNSLNIWRKTKSSTFGFHQGFHSKKICNIILYYKPMTPSQNIMMWSINNIPHSLRCVYLGSVTIRKKKVVNTVFILQSLLGEKSYKSHKTKLEWHVAFQGWFLSQSTYSHCQLLRISQDKTGDCECSFHPMWLVYAFTTWNCNF